MVEAATGGEALRLVAQKPDLVILDINLPDIDGFEVCRRIKESSETASVAVLHLSASRVGSEERSEGLEGGADGYLTYPLEPRELVDEAIRYNPDLERFLSQGKNERSDLNESYAQLAAVLGMPAPT